MLAGGLVLRPLLAGQQLGLVSAIPSGVEQHGF
jgi:hypothetical protein